MVGGTVTLRGAHFTPHGRIGFTLDDTISIVDTNGNQMIEADKQGNFAETVVATQNWGSGPHTLNAEDAAIHKVASFPILVTGQSASLRPPHLSLSSTSLNFGVGDQTGSSIRTITLTNVGGGLISWQGTCTQDWVQVSPGSGTIASEQSGRVMIAIDRSHLQPGPYEAQIIFSSSAGEVTLSIKIEVMPSSAGREAVLQLTPSLLPFKNVDGSPPPQAQMITVSNSGVKPLPWHVTANASWLSASPQSDTIASNSSEHVQISVNSSSLVPGTYEGVITFKTQGPDAAINSLRSVYVNLTITPGCSLQVSPGILTFSSVYLQPAPRGKTIDLDASPDCTHHLQWHTLSHASWLSIAMPNGTTPASPKVSINTTYLTPGVYTGSIIFNTSTGTQTLLVTFTLGQPTTPLLTVTTSNTTLSFQSIIGQHGNPPAQTIKLSNAGGGTLRWSVIATTTIGGAWLAVAPTSGKLTAHQSTSLAVQVSLLKSLVAGTYNGIITISGTDQTGHAIAGNLQTLPVTFVVQDACTLLPSSATLNFVGALDQIAPPTQAITLQAYGACNHSLNWTITANTTSANEAWLIASPAKGTATLATPGTTNIGVMPMGLLANTYRGTLTITVTDSLTHKLVGAPQAVHVIFTLQPACTLQVPPDAVQSFEVGVGNDPATRTFTVSVSGACPGNVTITPTVTLGSGENWLRVIPDTVTILAGESANFTTKVTSAALPSGPYTGLISLAAVNHGMAIIGSPQTIGVGLTVLAPPALLVSPGSLTINVTTGTTWQPILVSNSGDMPLNWIATLTADSPPFVSLSANSGTNLAGGANTTVTIIVNATGVIGGKNYTANVMVSAIDPNTGKPTTGSPVTIPVTIAVAPPALQVSANDLTYETPTGSNPPAQSIVVNNVGGDTLTWQVGTPSQSWLLVSPTTGDNVSQATSLVTLAINTAGLDAWIIQCNGGDYPFGRNSDSGNGFTDRHPVALPCCKGNGSNSPFAFAICPASCCQSSLL